MADLPEPKLFTADDWNEQAIQAVEKEGKAADGSQKYAASKTLAEKGMRRTDFEGIRPDRLTHPICCCSGMEVL
jgi:hypothetical protein